MMRLLLIASGGGHLTELWWLRDWWSQYERSWVCFDTVDGLERLHGERVAWATHPTNRSAIALARNGRLAWEVLRRERPDVVVTTGAAVAVPFVTLARTMGIPSVYIEPWDRVHSPSLTGRLLVHVADRVVLQWESQRAFFPRGILLGPMR